MQAMGVEWNAKETSISNALQNTDEEVSLFGLNISEEERSHDLLETKLAEGMLFQVEVPPPRKIDWRDHENCSWVTSVKNQKNCGSCVSFATCASLEARARIKEQDCRLDIDLSEAHLFFCGAGQACNKGWNFAPAMAQCKNVGVGAESMFPYIPRNQACKQIPSIVKIDGHKTSASMLARMKSIADSGPVIAGIKVYEDFYYYGGGVYRHVSGAFKGLHAVCVVGYDDEKDFWIVKNSWGTNWGDQGYVYIAFGECGIDSAYPFYDPNVVYLGGSPIN